MPGTNLLTPDEKGENFTSTFNFAFGLNAVDNAVGLGPYLSRKDCEKVSLRGGILSQERELKAYTAQINLVFPASI